MIVLYHLTPAANLGAIARDGLVPSIGARSTSAAESEWAVYCFRTLNTLDDGLANWMVDEFDEDEPLALLRIELPDNYAPYVLDVAFETQVHIHVRPEHITVLSDDYGSDVGSDASVRGRVAALDAAR